MGGVPGGVGAGGGAAGGIGGGTGGAAPDPGKAMPGMHAGTPGTMQIPATTPTPLVPLKQ